VKIVDRSVRSLVGLNGASTSRVLNLVTVERLHGSEAEYKSIPLFKSGVINSSIILKHRLRADEDYLIGKGKLTATKIILPFNKADLKAGGRSMLVDQRGFAETLLDIGGYGSTEGNFEKDAKVLRLFDAMPSLDPFILRECLARHDVKVADCYFSISKSDQAKMKEYVTEQVRRLSQLATGGDGSAADVTTPRLAVSLLSNVADQRLEPLRKAFGLEEEEFREGAFAWRGFLYYKWRMETLVADSNYVVKQIELVRPIGRISAEQRNFITMARARVSEVVNAMLDDIAAVISRYDDVYSSLVANQNPKAFCDFLLAAPPLFMDLGEMIGAIEHVVSYWKYRFPDDAPLMAEAEEVETIFQDFLMSFPKRPAPAVAV
jgi:predicted nucleic-acid-binding protein